MVIFCSNKKELHNIKDAISSYLNNNLGLTLKKELASISVRLHQKWRALWKVFRFHSI